MQAVMMQGQALPGWASWHLARIKEPGRLPLDGTSGHRLDGASGADKQEVKD
jgi:hypothetical protein